MIFRKAKAVSNCEDCDAPVFRQLQIDQETGEISALYFKVSHTDYCVKKEYPADVKAMLDNQANKVDQQGKAHK